MSTCGEGLSPPEDRLAVSWPAVFLMGGAVGCQAMRRLLRIVLNAASLLSLALCLVTVGAFVRNYGYRACDSAEWQGQHVQLSVDSADCTLRFEYNSQPLWEMQKGFNIRHYGGENQNPTLWGHLDF